MNSKAIYKDIRNLHPFLILTLTQGLSALGSAMTGFALIIWSYTQEGSALSTALLSVCSYVPYVAMSIFAGTISDRFDKKRTMLVCDAFAAVTTIIVMALLETGRLQIGHLYAINAVNGLMNTVQRPAADVAVTLLTPKEYYQQASAIQSMVNSCVNLLTPVLATALLTGLGLRAVIAADLLTFAVAFIALLLFIHIPEIETKQRTSGMLRQAGEGLSYLGEHVGVLHLILFLAGINLIASMFNAALPARILPVSGGGETALATVSTVTGLATLAGGLLAAAWPRPKSRVKMIVLSLFLSMSTENFALAFGHVLPVWCMGAVLGWIAIPLMNANMDALLRGYIPVEMQGRVFSARNTLQFFTIPIGYFLGGWLVDDVLEPMMAAQMPGSMLIRLFGSGKGAGAAVLFAWIAVAGVLVCCVFARDKAIWALEKE